MNLVDAIVQIERQKEKKEIELKREIESYNKALNLLRGMNDVCERCYGRGNILRSRACAEDDRPDPNDTRDYIKCPMCHGTGKAVKNEVSTH